MIIRRMAEAIRTQNWFTVFIEFTLVVAGVLVALQFDNWNQARNFDEQERDFLKKLRTEVKTNNDALQHRITFAKNVTYAGDRVLTFLKQDKPCAADCTQLYVDFFHASQVWGAPSFSSIYQEMRRLGLPRSPDVTFAMEEYYSLFEGVNTLIDPTPAYRSQVRSRIPANDIGLMWQHCYEIIEGLHEKLHPDCGGMLGVPDPLPEIEYIRTLPNLYDNLNGWMGQNVFSVQLLQDNLDRGNKTIAVIDAELERTK